MTRSQPPAQWVLSRRRFLIGLGSAGALLLGGVVAVDRGRPRLVDVIQERGTGPQNAPVEPNLWFALGQDGRVNFYVPKIEMGQGIHTALAQIAAEELALDVQQIDVRQANTAHGFDPALLFTFGSSSVSALYTPLRQAAATLREMVCIEGARQLRVARDAVDVRQGRCFLRGEPEHGRSYGQIVAAKHGAWEVPQQLPALTSRTAFTTIGQAVPRVDVAAKLVGTAVYGYDARLPGMLYGAVARPPRYDARLVAAAEGTTAQQPGVVAVVIDQEAQFAGVVAKTRTQARAALSHLALRWEGGSTISQDEIEARVTARERGGVVLRRVGDVDQALRQGQAITAEYRTPLAAHAHLEPLAALAHVQAERITVWAPTQHPQRVITEVRAALGGSRPIQIYPTYLGGGFGRKAGQSAAVEAARLSAAVAAPVHVGWTREEDLRHGYFRPPTHTVLHGSIDAAGHILGIEQRTASGDILWGVEDLPGGALTRGVLGFDPGVMIGQFTVYDIPHYRVVNHRVPLPVPTGPWRGLGLYANVFALESFMDELAVLAGADPVQFRLRHLPATAQGQRLRRVLEAAAAQAGWDVPLAAGRARGVACCFDVGTAVAQIAEVSVEGGAVRVHQITAVVDPGLVINPAGARLQTQGAIVMGLSSALHEHLTVENGMVVASNFHQYPLLSLRETPVIDVVLLESGDTPFGMGEPPIGPVAAAVANAVWACTGQRIRSLPLALGHPQ